MITNKQIATTLTKAANLLERSRWIKGISATDTTGARVSPRSKKAVAFCAAGALSAVTRHCVPAAQRALNAMLPRTTDFIEYNDDRYRQKRHVVSLFRKTVAKLLGKESSSSK